MNKSELIEKKPLALQGIGQKLIILIFGIILGFLLLIAVYALPVDRMEVRVLESVPTLDTASGGEERLEPVLAGYKTTILDNFTDAILLSTAIYRSDESLIKQATNLYRYAYPGSLSQHALVQLLETGVSHEEPFTYERYWLGSMVILKPLLMVMNYVDIRMLNTIVQGGILIWIIVLMQKRGLVRYILPFALSLIVITPAIIGYSLQYSTVFYVFSIAMLILLLRPKLVFERIGTSTFFLLIGMMTSYTDFLTYPIATFGMPFMLTLLLSKEENGRKAWAMLINLGIWWVAGYLGMWAGKWVITLLFSGNEAFSKSLLDTLTTRSSLSTLDESFSYIDVFRINLDVFKMRPYKLLGLCTFLGYGLGLLKAFKNRKTLSFSYALVFLATALLPFAWYVIASNHSYIHPHFTSRALMVTAFSFCCLLTRFMEQKTAAMKQ